MLLLVKELIIALGWAVQVRGLGLWKHWYQPVQVDSEGRSKDWYLPLLEGFRDVFVVYFSSRGHELNISARKMLFLRDFLRFEMSGDAKINLVHFYVFGLWICSLSKGGGAHEHLIVIWLQLSDCSQFSFTLLSTALISKGLSVILPKCFQMLEVYEVGVLMFTSK